MCHDVLFSAHSIHCWKFFRASSCFTDFLAALISSPPFFFLFNIIMVTVNSRWLSFLLIQLSTSASVWCFAFLFFQYLIQREQSSGSHSSVSVSLCQRFPQASCFSDSSQYLVQEFVEYAQANFSCTHLLLGKWHFNLSYLDKGNCSVIII